MQYLVIILRVKTKFKQHELFDKTIQYYKETFLGYNSFNSLTCSTSSCSDSLSIVKVSVRFPAVTRFSAIPSKDATILVGKEDGGREQFHSCNI